MELIRLGAHGDAVRDVQHRLARFGCHIDPDEMVGRFGASTQAAVKAFQRERRLPSDGIVGPDTWNQLVEAGWSLGDRPLYLHEPPFRGDDVSTLQRKLNALGFDAWKEDGIFGPKVDAAIRQFQRNVALDVDGIVGAETAHEVDRMRPDLALPSRAAVREAATAGAMQGLAGAVIAIDPGHGPADPGTVGLGGVVEHEVMFRLATALAESFTLRGARPTLVRAEGDTPGASERAAAGNNLGAAVFISLHCNDADPTAEGATCLYFGSDVSHSPAGERLAEHIQSELVSHAGLRDCRTHPMTLTILRETQMPAVQVEPCFITNLREAELLADDAFIRTVADAIAIGVERFLAGP